MLAGVRQANDRLGVVHSHLARSPARQTSSQIPKAFSNRCKEGISRKSAGDEPFYPLIQEREGLVPEDYVRKLAYKGQEVALESETKGYRFKLTPPVPVTVLEGDVKGDPKAIKHMVPLATVP